MNLTSSSPARRQSGNCCHRPENAEFALLAGRYALVIKWQAYDFSVVGQITDAAHILNAPMPSMGSIYSECRGTQ